MSRLSDISFLRGSLEYPATHDRRIYNALFRIAILAVLTLPSLAAADIITGTDSGSSHVKVFDGLTGSESSSFFAYSGFTGGVRVGTGDLNGDGFADIITGAGPGASGGHVKVFDGLTGAQIRSFFAYPSFTGGVFVSGGDVNGDGFADIITGTDAGSSHVKVFDGLTGSEIRSFFAYSGFTGGVRVGTGDLNGDGFADIITGAGPGASGGHVKVFDGLTGAEIRSFFAYPSFAGGVFVAGSNAAVPQTVPEPTSAVLLMLGGLALAISRLWQAGRRTDGGAGHYT